MLLAVFLAMEANHYFKADRETKRIEHGSKEIKIELSNDLVFEVRTSWHPLQTTCINIIEFLLLSMTYWQNVDMFNRDALLIGPPTRVKLLIVKYEVKDLEGNLLGQLVSQQKAVPHYIENNEGLRMSEVRIEGKMGLATRILIYDSLNQVRGVFEGGGSMTGILGNKTRSPCTLKDKSGQVLCISDAYKYKSNLGSYEGAKKSGFLVRGSERNVITSVHAENRSNAIQVDFLVPNLDRLAIMNFIAILVT